jgi:hypothetical protein
MRATLSEVISAFSPGGLRLRDQNRVGDLLGKEKRSCPPDSTSRAGNQRASAS